MNCLEFENEIIDLAKGVSLSSEIKLHAQDCSRCAIRLANAEAMKATLLHVATVDKNAAPSPNLEAALLTAFRQQHEKKSVPAIGWMDSVYALFGQLKWGLATAVVLILLGLAVAQMLPNDSQIIVVKTPELKPSISASLPVLEPKIIEAPVPEPERELVKRSPINSIRTIPVAYENRSGRLPKPTSSTSVEVGDFEILEPDKPLSAKDFIAFDYAETMPPADNLQLMRVKLAREKLASMGLTMPRNIRQSPFVNADLLVGSDGVPRAINAVSLR